MNSIYINICTLFLSIYKRLYRGIVKRSYSFLLFIMCILLVLTSDSAAKSYVPKNNVTELSVSKAYCKYCPILKEPEAR